MEESLQKGLKQTESCMNIALLTMTTSKPQTADVPNRKPSSRLDDWVLCRIYKKNSSQRPIERDKDYTMEGMLATVLPTSSHQNPKIPTSKATTYGSMVQHEEKYYEGILTEEDMQNSSISQIATSSISKQNLSMALAATTTLPPPY
ncbi:hypothetical protein PTKIN_Ptkin01aG0122500 [Pterospermum kingtungense]